MYGLLGCTGYIRGTQGVSIKGLPLDWQARRGELAYVLLEVLMADGKVHQ